MPSRFSPARARRAAGLLALLSVAAPSAAHAAATTTTDDVTIARAVQRADCANTRLAGQAGTTTVPFTAPVDGAYRFALRGGHASDWDMSVYKHDTQKKMAGSGAWGADETITLLLREGWQVDVQLCRISGAAKMALSIAGTPEALMPLGTPPPSDALVEIKTDSLKQARALGALGLNLNEDVVTRGRVRAVLSKRSEFELLDKLGFAYRTVVPDLAARDRRQREQDRANSAKVRATGAETLPSGRTEYRHLEDVQSDLKKVAQDFPALVRPVTLPKKSFQGREQMGVEISSNVNATDDQKPVSFIMGEHHAREWPAGEMPPELAFYLAKGYGSDKDVTALLNRTRVVIVPVINPDGYVASRDAPISPADATGDPTGLGTTVEGVAPPGGNLAYRRKNCRGASPSPLTPCELQYGIDPNRNYGFNWGGYGASTDVNSQSYRGPGPWSETETQSVHEFSQVHDVTSLMTIHTIAALVLRPPGTQAEGQAPDEAPLKALGDAMGADTGYTSQFGYQLYDTSGTTEDWNYGAAGTFGYTIELGPSGGDFHGAYQEYVTDQWYGTEKRKGRGMRQALLRIINAATDQAQFSTIAGRAPAGRVLRLKKTFQTSTSPVCTAANVLLVSDPAGATDCVAPGDPILIDDKLEYTTKVPANGVFSWIVTPSTRPFKHKKGELESWTLTCEDDQGKVYETKTVQIWRGEKQSFELPCGGTLAPLATGVKDKLAPKSNFTKKSLKATRNGVQIGGTSADFAPAGLTPKVSKVYVALGRRFGSKCRFVKANGAFGDLTSCLRTKYLPAKGTTTWTFLFKHKLPAGKYLAWARGVDAVGNRERKDKKRNLITFTIK